MDVRGKLSSEKQLIDADAMMRIYQEVLCPHVRCVDCSLLMDDGTCRFETMIREAPAIDAVPVVRCKDCKWLYDEMDNYCCRSHRGLVRICENSFCSYGERKDGDGNGICNTL